MSTQSLARSHVNGPSVEELLSGRPDLGFQPVLLGHSGAAVVPQRVGDWWLEPLTPNTVLSPRASERLATVIASGVQPKAVIVFHEIQPNEPAARGIAAQLDSVCGSINEIAPVLTAKIGRHATSAGLRILGCAASGARAAWRSFSRLNIDPCLVIVTQDDDWVELDRWYD